MPWSQRIIIRTGGDEAMGQKERHDISLCFLTFFSRQRWETERRERNHGRQDRERDKQRADRWVDDGTASLYVLEMSTTLVVDVLGVQKNKECYRNLNFQKVLSQPAKRAAVWGAGGGNSSLISALLPGVCIGKGLRHVARSGSIRRTSSTRLEVDDSWIMNLDSLLHV